MPIDGDKQSIRRLMRTRRNAWAPAGRASASRRLSAALAGLSPEGPVAAYLATPAELDLTAYLREALTRGVAIAVPRWDGETYRLARLTGLDSNELRPGPMGVLEPRHAQIVAPSRIRTWLVPGLAFTRRGLRLGYGGGWYDRLLARADAGAARWGVACAFQVMDALPAEEHDISLTGLILVPESGDGPVAFERIG